MATSFGALCNDFYINVKLALKMELPSDRETVLHLFDRVRRAEPSMERFANYDTELALESSRREAEQRWLSLRRNSVRAGHVNPDSMEAAYRFHDMILEAAPHHLTISPLDVDYLELLLGFDLDCRGNHDEVVYEALYADTPLAHLGDVPNTRVLDVQPVFGLALTESGDTQAHFEVRTRSRRRRGRARYRDEPISVFLTMRRYGPVKKIEDLLPRLHAMRNEAEQLASERLVPYMLTPIARHITSDSA